MAQHDQQQTGQRTTRETVPSYAGNSPPQITSYDQGCAALKKILSSRDTDPVSIWQTLLPAVENLMDGRAEQIALSFDHGTGQFRTQVSQPSSQRFGTNR